jgi:hypothetical protein
VKSDTATIYIPELELEIPPQTQRGSLNTIEGVLVAVHFSEHLFSVLVLSNSTIIEPFVVVVVVVVVVVDLNNRQSMDYDRISP